MSWALAHHVVSHNPAGLNSLVRLMARPLEGGALTGCAITAAHEAPQSVQLEQLVGRLSVAVSPDGHTAFDLICRVPDLRYQIALGVIPTLATPRERTGLASSLANIGYGRWRGPWRAENKHRLHFILPYGIALVDGGNHSLAAGIANGEGRVVTTETMDLSGLYPFIHYDGATFRRRHDQHELGRPAEPVLGELFEIGRLMVEHDVTTDVKTVQQEASTGSGSRIMG